MTYEKAVTFSGDAGRAVDFAAAALTGAGFRIDRRTESAVEATGPGMTSTNQNPLRGMTRAEVRVTAGSVAIRADLGGVRWMRNFLLIFPAALCVFFVVLFTVLSLTGSWQRTTDGDPHTFKWVWGLLAFTPWPVLGPWMAGRIRRRTERAIDDFLGNLVTTVTADTGRAVGT